MCVLKTAVLYLAVFFQGRPFICVVLSPWFTCALLLAPGLAAQQVALLLSFFLFSAAMQVAVREIYRGYRRRDVRSGTEAVQRQDRFVPSVCVYMHFEVHVHDCSCRVDLTIASPGRKLAGVRHKLYRVVAVVLVTCGCPLGSKLQEGPTTAVLL